MEGILDRTKRLFENKRKCREGIATLHSTTFVSQKFCKSLTVIETYKNTIGRAVSTTCPNCNLEEETPNHNVGECVFSKNFKRKFFEKEKTE